MALIPPDNVLHVGQFRILSIILPTTTLSRELFGFGVICAWCVNEKLKEMVVQSKRKILRKEKMMKV